MQFTVHKAFNGWSIFHQPRAKAGAPCPSSKTYVAESDARMIATLKRLMKEYDADGVAAE